VSERREPRPLREGLDRVVHALGAPGVDALQAVFSDWATVAGERLAGHTRPVAVRDRVLVVAADDPAWATEARYRQAEVLSRIAERAGEGVVERVEIRVRDHSG
jgi:predicted nucleic acid-binding Zn ribbon protein